MEITKERVKELLEILLESPFYLCFTTKIRLEVFKELNESYGG